jgi:hypothetical protein
MADHTFSIGFRSEEEADVAITVSTVQNSEVYNV